MLRVIVLICSLGSAVCLKKDLCTPEGGTCVKSAAYCDGWLESYDLGCGTYVCCKPAPVTAKPAVEHPENSSCGIITRVNKESNPLLRIIGGDPALEGEWPWQVAILDLSGNHFCGGTLISPEFVVTAAHCFVSYTETEVVIVLGEHHLVHQTGNEITRKAHIIVKHTGYSPNNQADDFAFIQLDSPVDNSGHYVRTACLPTPEELDYTWSPTDKCYVTGWGYTYSMAGDSRHLQHVPVTVVPQSACSTAWTGHANITDKQICAGTGTIGTCHGDSGGPLVCQRNNRYYLVGVTSFGHGSCNWDGFPDVYTRITSYLDWMNSYILLLHAAV